MLAALRSARNLSLLSICWCASLLLAAETTCLGDTVFVAVDWMRHDGTMVCCQFQLLNRMKVLLLSLLSVAIKLVFWQNSKSLTLQWDEI